MPSEGVPSEQFFVGMTGHWPRKQAPTSVPPDRFMIGMRPSPTTSEYYLYGSGFHGSPVEPRIWRLDRSWLRTGSSPAGIRALTRVGEIPRMLTRWRSTMSHRRSGAG